MQLYSNRLTRRGVLFLAAGAGATRLFAASDFWNKKDPKDWTNDEIDRLTTNSPWAKQVNVQMESNGAYDPSSPQSGPAPTGQPRIGLGIPGIGFPGGGGGYPGGGGGGWPGSGGGGGRRRGGGQYNARGTILWESAEPVMLALKPEFPDAFKDHVVITLGGFDIPSSQDDLDRMKNETYLRPSGGSSVQPGVVDRPISSSVHGSVIFGFAKDLLRMSPEDKDVTLTTRVGRTAIQTRFVPKEMMFHGKLAV